MDNYQTKLKDFLLDTFFPKFCFGCKKEGSYLCYDCRTLLEILEYRYCLCDKKPFRLSPSQTSGKCARCQPKKLNGLYFALSYKEKILTRRLIHRFKYSPYVKDLGETLAGIVVEHLILSRGKVENLWENATLISIPSDKQKMKLRGFNQSAILADYISKMINIPVEKNILFKTKPTEPQMKLSKEERQKNLLGAFTIKNPSWVEGKTIFLVDDVYTTGSTMEACATALKENGAKAVWGLAIAREE